jgi:hypothetical protein
MNYSIKKALSYRIRLHHNPRAFQKAQVYVTTNTLAKSYNLSLSDVLQPEFVHILDVVAYSIEDVST